jgi:hypothetical protein
VVEHYNNLVTGAFGDARRISANDKARLSDHMDLVADLAQRMDRDHLAPSNVACDPQSGNSGNVTNSMYNPAPYADLSQWHQDYNSVFAAAIACGASRIATVRVENTFHSSSSFWINHEQWHDPVAHRAEWTLERWANQGNASEHPQDTLVAAKRNFYRDVFIDMIQRLDAIDAGDRTSLLDRGLVMWTQESGPQTHMSDSIPVVTAGSASGFFNTGHYFDFRNRQASSLPRGKGADNPELYAARVPGILYNQWLSNVLQSMGMRSIEFQRDHPEGWAGYGHANIESPSHHPPRLLADANNEIPKVVFGT